MEGLNLDSILDDADIDLFSESEPEQEDEVKDTDKKTTEVDPEGMFEEKPESVGSDDNENNEEQEDTHSDENQGTSPDKPFFSSIAEAFAEEGILPNLDEETIKNIKTPEDFRKAIDDYIKSELDEQQQRIKEALDANVEIDTIKNYENALATLNNISEDSIRAENEDGEDLRKKLIYQDYLNKGFSKERAEKEVNKSISNGTDIDDAIDALSGIKDGIKKEYDSLLKERRVEQDRLVQARKKQEEDFKNSILNEKNKLFGDLEVDAPTRKKIFENLAKPTYRDAKTGEVLTAIQKYQKDNPDEFLTKVGLLFTLTDGFKSLDKIVQGKVKKEVKRGFKDLESKINNTSRDSYGNLKFTSGVDDSESYLGKGIRLNL